MRHNLLAESTGGILRMIAGNGASSATSSGSAMNGS